MASAKSKETYKLDRVLVRNFKSYAGDQEIGPFSTFSSIVGPNGAGLIKTYPLMSRER
jgi:hypothetical protein